MLLRKCCFVMPLRFGAAIAAFFTLLFSLYFLVMGTQILLEYVESDIRPDDELLDVLLYFGVFSLSITMFIFLYVGLINELPAFLLYWLVGTVILVSILAVYIIHQYLDEKAIDPADIILLGMLLIWIYLWVVVLSYKAELTEC